MEREHDVIISADLPDLILLEVHTSVLVESNHLGTAKGEAEYASGNKLLLDIDLYEQYLGDEGSSNVPVIKYSTEENAPALSRNVRLKTPNYYRGWEISGTGWADPFEGCRFSHRFETGSLSLTAEYESGIQKFEFDLTGATRMDLCTKTFMYCTSLYSGSGLLSKRDANAVFEQDYTHGSVFPNSKELAQHILKNFMAGISRAMLNVAEPNEVAETTGEELVENFYAWVVHGPVRYSPDVDMGMPTIESYFTKPDTYRNQNEYRFWFGFMNTPSQKDEATLLMPIPEGMATAIELE